MDWLNVVVVVLALAVGLGVSRWWARAVSVVFLGLALGLALDLSGAISRELISRRRAAGRLTPDYRAGVYDQWKKTAEFRDRRLLLITAGLAVLALVPVRRRGSDDRHS